MKKLTAKAKRQQVKKAQKGHGIWTKRTPDGTKRTVPVRRDTTGADPGVLAERVNRVLSAEAKLRNLDQVLGILTGT